MRPENRRTEQRFRVLIAGGGVAALEALLALRELAGDRVAIELFAPDPSFRHRPLSVTEPFALATPRRVELLEVALENNATFLKDALAGVDPGQRLARTAGGRELGYDALLIATGTRSADSVPGAITFRDSMDGDAFRTVLDDMERGVARSITFAVPNHSSWPLGLYELALLTSAHAREQVAGKVALQLVTPEAFPLAIFGRRASAVVHELLRQAGVELLLNRTPKRYEDGRLEASGGDPIECDRVVTLPIPKVPDMPGIPKVNGFIPVDRFCSVLGLEGVYAAGDVTWFPIKQGGLAAQQADCAARAIARSAGARVEPEPFRPILRGALLTGWGPRYLRTNLDQPNLESVGARSVLWWPPAKVAGRLLAPYLAAKAGYPEFAGRALSGDHALSDLDAPVGDDGVGVDAGHDDAVGLALTSADADARWRDFRGALRWLEVAEDLQLYLPSEYELKRMSWEELARSA
jgi:sulfide:quinone oxidoreductase